MPWGISGKDNLNGKQNRDTGFSVPEITSGVRPSQSEDSHCGCHPPVARGSRGPLHSCRLRLRSLSLLLQTLGLSAKAHSTQQLTYISLPIHLLRN